MGVHTCRVMLTAATVLQVSSQANAAGPLNLGQQTLTLTLTLATQKTDNRTRTLTHQSSGTPTPVVAQACLVYRHPGPSPPDRCCPSGQTSTPLTAQNHWLC